MVTLLVTEHACTHRDLHAGGANIVGHQFGFLAINSGLSAAATFEAISLS
jgi:hypothetical protein